MDLYDEIVKLGDHPMSHEVFYLPGKALAFGGRIANVILQLPRLQDRLEALDQVDSGFKATIGDKEVLIAEFDSYVRRMQWNSIDQLLNGGDLSKADSKLMASYIPCFGRTEATDCSAFSIALLQIEDQEDTVANDHGETNPWMREQRIAFAKPFLSSIWNDFNSLIMSADLAARVLPSFIKVHLLSGIELRELVEHTIPAGLATEAEIQARLLASIDGADEKVFLHTLIPFVQEILEQKVCCYKYAGADEHFTDASKNFVTYVLQQYVLTCVAPEPKRDMSIQVYEEMGCGECSDCEAVNEFLEDPDEEVLELPRYPAERAHLYFEFNNQNEELYTIDTLRRRNPEVWQMTKKTPSSDEHDAWVMKQEQVWEYLECVHGEKWDVEEYVGDRYDGIFKVDPERIMQDRRKYPLQIPRITGPMGGTDRGATRSRKRSADDVGGGGSSKRVKKRSPEVIDLTSSSPV
ncbi:hypothetical protein H2200_000699 [Cladophialophora chaetospira]|uniref:Uncharacterized protein n=1 Tax=Cladophialophora chaetospira TaxID=386627 RepID=A0AA38XNW5_9EURO|nr:hypothetical protein H2200_000699 [Cladophialophora chaetospira]